MPGTAAHCLLAWRTIAAWEKRGDCPFPPREKGCIRAFLNGALGPDMGVFSRSHAFISNLSHYVRSADLSRAIVQQARSEQQLAFAWGWVSHVLADVQLHVLVNRGVGELLTGDRRKPIAYADDRIAHVRLEVGMDAACFQQLEPGQASTFPAIFDAQSIQFLGNAFDAIYGQQVVGRSALLQAHRECARYSGWIRRLNEVHAARLRSEAIPACQWPFYVGIYMPSKQLARWRPHTMAYAASHPVKPAGWLVAELETHIIDFPAAFFELVDSNLDRLPNCNLDLGYVERDDAPYTLTQSTLDDLARRRRETNPGGSS